MLANRSLIVGSIGVALGSGLLAWPVAWPVARLVRADVRTFVPPMMFNNCGNMGLPLAVLAYVVIGNLMPVAFVPLGLSIALRA